MIQNWTAFLTGQALVTTTASVLLYHILRTRLGALITQSEPCNDAEQHPRKASTGLSSRAMRNARIVVNTLPKVGTHSVVMTLLKAFPGVPLDHLHFLSAAAECQVARVLELAGESDFKLALLHHYTRMTVVRQEVERLAAGHPGNTGVYFVSGTREPVSWALSYLFQLHSHRLVPDEMVQTVNARRAIMDWLQGKAPCRYVEGQSPENWFQQEVQGYLGLDLTQIGFNTAAGFQVYETLKGRPLVFRNESIYLLPEGLAALFNVPSHRFETSRANAAEDKATGGLYRDVRAALRFPASFLEEVYSRPYSATFYSADERKALVEKWHE